MKKPDTFTITTFWMDWLLLPIMLGAAWLTVSWALADLSRASHLDAAGATLPAWAVFIPLFVSAAGWVIVGRWRIEGSAKMLVGIGIAVMLIIASLGSTS